MDEDVIAILTFPYNDDITSVYMGTKRIFPIILIIFQIIFLMTHAISSLIYPKFIKPNDLNSYFTPNSVLIYCHLLVWLLVMLCRYLMKRFHLTRLHILGYHRHYLTVHTLTMIPSFIYHHSNALILLFEVIFCKHKDIINGKDLDFVIHINIASNEIVINLITILQVIINLTVLTLIICLLIHLYYEYKFRTESKPPDAFCIDDPQHFDHAGLNDVGIRSSTLMENLLEKQADLINNLKSQNSHLRMMLLKLSQRRDSTQNILSITSE